MHRKLPVHAGRHHLPGPHRRRRWTSGNLSELQAHRSGNHRDHLYGGEQLNRARQHLLLRYLQPNRRYAYLRLT